MFTDLVYTCLGKWFAYLSKEGHYIRIHILLRHSLSLRKNSGTQKCQRSNKSRFKGP